MDKPPVTPPQLIEYLRKGEGEIKNLICNSFKIKKGIFMRLSECGFGRMHERERVDRGCHYQATSTPS